MFKERSSKVHGLRSRRDLFCKKGPEEIYFVKKSENVVNKIGYDCSTYTQYTHTKIHTNTHEWAMFLIFGTINVRVVVCVAIVLGASENRVWCGHLFNL